MKVSFIHTLRNNQYKGFGVYKQNFSNSASYNNLNALDKLDKNDVFVRLASASIKDARIEKELYEMNLI